MVDGSDLFKAFKPRRHSDGSWINGISLIFRVISKLFSLILGRGGVDATIVASLGSAPRMVFPFGPGDPRVAVLLIFAAAVGVSMSCAASFGCLVCHRTDRERCCAGLVF